MTEEVDALQAKLKENRAASLQEGDKLRQLRKEQREISKQNADLTTKLSMAQVSELQWHLCSQRLQHLVYMYTFKLFCPPPPCK